MCPLILYPPPHTKKNGTNLYILCQQQDIVSKQASNNKFWRAINASCHTPATTHHPTTSETISHYPTPLNTHTQNTQTIPINSILIISPFNRATVKTQTHQSIKQPETNQPPEQSLHLSLSLFSTLDNKLDTIPCWTWSIFKSGWATVCDVLITEFGNEVGENILSDSFINDKGHVPIPLPIILLGQYG